MSGHSVSATGWLLDGNGAPWVSAFGCDWGLQWARAPYADYLGTPTVHKIRTLCCVMDGSCFDGSAWQFGSLGRVDAEYLRCCFDDFRAAASTAPTWIRDYVLATLAPWGPSTITRTSIDEAEEWLPGDDVCRFVFDGETLWSCNVTASLSGNGQAFLYALHMLQSLGALPGPFDLLLHMEDVLYEPAPSGAPIFAKQKRVRDRHIVLIPHEYLMTHVNSRYELKARTASAIAWEDKASRLFWRGALTAHWACDRSGENCQRCASQMSCESDFSKILKFPRTRLVQLSSLAPRFVDAKFSLAFNATTLEVLHDLGWVVKSATGAASRAGTAEASDAFFYDHKYLWVDEHTDAGFHRVRGNSLLFQTVGSFTHWMMPRGTCLKPWEHFVPVPYNQSSLLELLRWAFRNDKRAMQMAERAEARATECFSFQMVLAYLHHLLAEYRVRLEPRAASGFDGRAKLHAMTGGVAPGSTS